ncbi:hypothetical protein ACWF0M_17585 [Kribbella sp. NPDC055110]
MGSVDVVLDQHRRLCSGPPIRPAAPFGVEGGGMLERADFTMQIAFARGSTSAIRARRFSICSALFVRAGYAAARLMPAPRDGRRSDQDRRPL